MVSIFARGQVEWGAFEWMHVECFPNLIQLACLLPQKEDNLRSRISKVVCLPFEVYQIFCLTSNQTYFWIFADIACVNAVSVICF